MVIILTLDLFSIWDSGFSFFQGKNGAQMVSGAPASLDNLGFQVGTN